MLCVQNSCTCQPNKSLQRTQESRRCWIESLMVIRFRLTPFNVTDSIKQHHSTGWNVYRRLKLRQIFVYFVWEHMKVTVVYSSPFGRNTRDFSAQSGAESAELFGNGLTGLSSQGYFSPFLKVFFATVLVLITSSASTIYLWVSEEKYLSVQSASSNFLSPFLAF